MSQILLLGGYGGFGRRIAWRLAAAGHEVLVAGRSIDKASAFCGDAPSLIPLSLDRSEIATALEDHRPDMVVDASGPFQAMDHAIPKACIAAGVHYVDIKLLETLGLVWDVVLPHHLDRASAVTPILSERESDRAGPISLSQV